MSNNKNSNNILTGLVCIVIGILGISFAIIAFTTNIVEYVGEYTVYETYGGDAYTGIQQAAADAANNIVDLIYIIQQVGVVIRNTMGYLSLLFGLFVFAVGVKMLSNAVKVANYSNETDAQEHSTK